MSSEAILISGANVVAALPLPPHGVELIEAAIIAVVAFTVAKARTWPTLGAVALACALPGMAYVLVLRGDAPLTRTVVARDEVAAAQAMRQSAPWPDVAVRNVTTHDDVLAPLARYLWPVKSENRGGLEIDAQCPQLRPACVKQASVVQCGCSP